MVKNLPAMQQTEVRSVDQKDPLEQEMATHSSILAWQIPWTREPGGLQSMGPQRDTTEHVHLHVVFYMFTNKEVYHQCNSSLVKEKS